MHSFQMTYAFIFKVTLSIFVADYNLITSLDQILYFDICYMVHSIRQLFIPLNLIFLK
jgi:hypothetical protein